MKTLSLILSITIMLLPLVPASAQDNTEGYIFGKITTTSGETLEGFIRWGKEEAYWTDHLNATKRVNPYLKYLSKEDREFIEGGSTNWLSDIIIEAIDADAHVHSFSCMFGDVEWVKAAGGKAMEVKVKNGEPMLFKGGSNDLGASLRIYDRDGNERKLEWEQVDMVSFSPVKPGWKDPYSGPVWGKVETSFGTFTGQVQWDHDERLGYEVLDGDSDGNDLSIPFSDIRAISRDGRGSYVILKDGNTVFLTGSNDVNAENRGIIVSMAAKGRIDIAWDDFRKLTLMDEAAELPGYNDFQGSRAITGKVVTVSDAEFRGRIAYDLDEASSFEMLNGKQEMSEWQIPFALIKSIRPKNYKYSTVTLLDGSSLLIGRMQDVSESNDGMLVFPEQGEPEYIPWEKIQVISFD